MAIKCFGELAPNERRPFHRLVNDPTHNPLTEIERLMITARIMSGEEYGTIAKDFGVSKGTIEAIKRNRKWFKTYRKLIVKMGYNYLACQMDNAKLITTYVESPKPRRRAEE